MSKLGVAVFVAAFAAPCVAASATALGAEYGVESQTTVSGPVTLPAACQRYHDELYPQLATHPDAPRDLSVVYSVDGMTAKAAATSTNGGHTWSRSPIPAASTCSGGSSDREQNINPNVSGGPLGQVYFGESMVGHAYFGQSALGPADQLAVQDVELHASPDAGATWADMGSPPWDSVVPDGPSPAAATFASQDMGVAADPSDPKTVHAAWLDFTSPPNPEVVVPMVGKLVSATSHDSGTTWSPPVTVFQPTGDASPYNSRLFVNSDGSLLELYQNFEEANSVVGGVAQLEPFDLTTYATRSDDGGATWQAPVQIGANQYQDHTAVHYTPGPVDAATGPDGMAAAAWAELPSGGTGKIDLTLSHDGGRTWSAPSAAITAPGDAFAPAVAIAPNGDLGLFYYDLTDDTPGGDTLADAWFATSDDGGKTWTRTRLAGPFSIEASFEPALNGSYDDDSPLGFYEDAAAVGEGFGVTYTVGPPLATDGRTDVRFARVEELSP